MSTLERSGVSIHYDVFEGSGPPLMLLYGYMGTSAIWRIEGYVDALAGEFRLITLDLRGHGESGKPHDPSAYAVGEFVADAVAVLDVVGVGSAFLLGHSLGADIALAVAGRHPDRVAGVLALGPGCNLGFDDVPGPPPDEDWIKELETEGMTGVVKSFEAEGRPQLAAEIAAADPAAMVAVARALEVPIRVSGLRLRNLAVPLVCVWGEKETEPRNASLPASAQIVIIPGADHVGVLESRDVVLPLLRSLALSSTTAR